MNRRIHKKSVANDNYSSVAEQTKKVVNGKTFTETQTTLVNTEGDNVLSEDTAIETKNFGRDVVNDNIPQDNCEKNEEVVLSPSSPHTIEQMEKKQKNTEQELALAKKFLPKEEFELKLKSASAEAINLLMYELSLVPKLNAIDTTHKGCRSDLKDPSERPRTKKEILLQDFGLKEKTAWEIQQLTEDLVKRIIKKACDEQRLPTRGIGISLLKKEKEIAEAEAQAEEKAEIKKAKLEEKMAKDHEKYVAQTNQVPRVLNGKMFDVIYVDPDQTKMSINDIFNLNIPSADNAILFWWLQPNKLFETLEIIKKWCFQYSGEAVWNLEDQTVYSGCCFDQTHRILLMATKGENPPVTDQETRKKATVFTSRPDFDVIEKPTYYRETIERMFPTGAFLDVFGTDVSNQKWTLFLKDEKEASDGSDNN